MESKMFAVVIPALNEEHTIREVVLKVKRHALPIVVDDGSIDDTGFLAESSGAVVVRHKRNLGYDAALQTGFLKAIELKMTYVLTMDADGEHCAELIPKFKHSLSSGFDLVVGVRGSYQRVAESFFAFVTNLLWDIKDPLCGMKGYRLSFIEKLGFFGSYKSVGTECLIRAARSELKIQNITIGALKRNGNSRFGSGLIPNFVIMKALFVGLLRARRFN